jgi:hypothetical protein
MSAILPNFTSDFMTFSVELHRAATPSEVTAYGTGLRGADVSAFVSRQRNSWPS